MEKILILFACVNLTLFPFGDIVSFFSMSMSLFLLFFFLSVSKKKKNNPHIYYLTVSVDQNSRHSLTGSSA